MTASVITAADAQDQHWDVIIIGAGMGGGMSGRRLAEQGLSVLFLEKGPLGHHMEEQELREDIEAADARQMRGYWPTRIEAREQGVSMSFFAPLGSGVGGSSVFYAAALERPERHDLEDVQGLPHPTNGWPIRYDDFAPYMDQAADLLSVRGMGIPNSELPAPKLNPPPMTEAEVALFDTLRDYGLTPYRSHEAIRRIPGCTDCLGRKCPFRCKMDGRSAGVEPALETGNAHLLDNCSVLSMSEANGRITAVTAKVSDTTITLSGEIVVLAAGALHSPRLLQASGLANSSGWVGRGLMLHADERFAVFPRRGKPVAAATRAVSFRDFYVVNGQRLGLVQSLGFAADFGRIAAYLKSVVARTPLRKMPGIDRIATMVAAIATRIFGNATVFVGVMEDLAFFENRVTTHPDNPDVPIVEYTISDELRSRRKLLRRTIRKTFGLHRVLMLGLVPDLNYGHPSGTLRFGTDPKTSVLNAECRSHDLKNLFVTDSSFMPTSMGVNPSLTIAANALRVADVIAAELKSQTRKAS